MNKSISKLFIVPHSHIDIEWYWTKNELFNFVENIFRKNLFPVMKRDKDFTFVQDQSLIFEIMDEILSDEDIKLLEQRIKEGNFEFVGGMYVQPELAEPHGESLIKQILYGRNWSKKRFDINPVSAWFIDTFGLIPQIAQILLKSGFNSLTFMRDMPSERDPKNLKTEFYYSSPDGSKILTHWMSQTYAIFKEPDFGNKLLGITNQMTTNIAMLPWGNDLHFQDMDTNEIRQYINSEAKKLDIKIDEIVFGTVKEFFSELELKSEQIPCFDFDLNPPLYTQDLRGLFDGRIKLKILNRKAEYMLMVLERLLASAALIGCNEKNKYNSLQEMWTDVLYNQFHDIIGGSCVDETYIPALLRYENVILKARQLISRTLSPGIYKTPEAITVFNPVSFTRNDIVYVNFEFSKKESIHNLLIEDQNDNLVKLHIKTKELYNNGTLKNICIEFNPGEIKAFSTKHFNIIYNEQKHHNPKQSSNFFLENEFFKVSIDQHSGCITSILDKSINLELIDQQNPKANDIIAIEEDYPDMEGKFSFTDRIHKSSNTKADSIKIFEDDIVSKAIILKSFIGIKVSQEIYLYKGTNRVDFKTTLLNNEKKDLFIKISFPLNLNKKNSTPFYETPFATTKRPHGHFCAQRWAGLFDETLGVALINKGVGGYWTDKNVIELCILRSFSKSDTYMKAGIEKGLSLFKDKRTHTQLAQEKGHYEYEYSIVSTNNNDFIKIIKEAKKFNFPLYASPVNSFQNILDLNSPIEVETNNFIISFLQHNEKEKNFVFRGYEITGKGSEIKIKINFNYKEIFTTDILGNDLETLKLKSNYLTYTCKPHEIVTFKAVF